MSEPYCPFVVGQLVVCVKDKFGFDDVEVREGVCAPVKGLVYTIREIEDDSHGVWVMLMEIRNPIIEYDEGLSECVFHFSSFRPVSSISTLTELMNTAPSRAKSAGIKVIEITESVE